MIGKCYDFEMISGKRLFLTLLVLLISLSPSALAKETSFDIKDSQTTGSIVIRIINAHGGKKAIEEARSVYAKGKITVPMLGDEGVYVRYLKRDRKLRVEIRYQRTAELRILNGNKGYRGEAEGVITEVTGYRYISMLYQYKYLDIAYGVLKGLYNISYEGREGLNGAEVEVLALKDKEGLDMKAYVDPVRGLILKVTGYFSLDGVRSELSAGFADFRDVGRIRLPFEITSYAGGREIARIIIEDYRINPGMDDAMFEPEGMKK